MQEEFLALVAEERERGCAVFLSSHELDEVRAGLRPGRDRPRRAPDRGRADRRPARQGAASVRGRAAPTRRASSDCARCRASPSSRSPAAASTFTARRRPRRGGAGARRPPRRRPRGRPPSLEEVFLGYYEEGEARTVSARRSRAAGRSPISPTAAARCSPGACRSACGRPSSSRSSPRSKTSLSKAVQGYPQGAEGSLRDRRADQRRAVPARRDAEPDRAAGDRLPGGARGRQRPHRRRRNGPPRRPALGPGLAHAASSPRGFLATAVELAAVLAGHRRCSPASAASSPAPASTPAAPPRASPTSGRWRSSSPASASSPPASRCAPASSPARSPACWWRCT